MKSGKPAQDFIDTHVHVWTNDFKKYPLAAEFKVQDVNPPVFLPEEMLRIAEPSGVNRFVLVQMSYYGFDNSFMLTVMGKWPKVFKGIAVIDWKENAPDAAMRALARQGVSGFRLFLQGASVDALSNDKGLEKMFQCASAEGLVICFLINPEALPAVDRQCKKFPDAPVVIDHFARIGMKGLIRESDVQALCSLSRYPNVTIKVSGFYALGKAEPPHLDLAPLVKRVHEAFGPRRMIWGSDCPFQTVKESYEDSISLIRDRLDFLSRDDKDWILRRTAEELFFT